MTLGSHTRSKTCCGTLCGLPVILICTGLLVCSTLFYTFDQQRQSRKEVSYLHLRLMAQSRQSELQEKRVIRYSKMLTLTNKEAEHCKDELGMIKIPAQKNKKLADVCAASLKDANSKIETLEQQIKDLNANIADTNNKKSTTDDKTMQSLLADVQDFVKTSTDQRTLAQFEEKFLKMKNLHGKEKAPEINHKVEKNVEERKSESDKKLPGKEDVVKKKDDTDEYNHKKEDEVTNKNKPKDSSEVKEVKEIKMKRKVKELLPTTPETLATENNKIKTVKKKTKKRTIKPTFEEEYVSKQTNSRPENFVKKNEENESMEKHMADQIKKVPEETARKIKKKTETDEENTTKPMVSKKRLNAKKRVSFEELHTNNGKKDEDSKENKQTDAAITKKPKNKKYKKNNESST